MPLDLEQLGAIVLGRATGSAVAEAMTRDGEGRSRSVSGRRI